MKGKKQIPEYTISESIREIENPELYIIEQAKKDIIKLMNPNLSGQDLHEMKERSSV